MYVLYRQDNSQGGLTGMVKTSMRITKKPLSSLTKDILENPGFGIHFSDHMFSAEYEAGQWQRPENNAVWRHEHISGDVHAPLRSGRVRGA